MRTIILAGLAAASLSLSMPAQAAIGAAPFMAPDANVTLVEGGCGPAGFRAANGYCYRRRPHPPRTYRRACPPGFHLTPYGCRRNLG